jgi:hypothetical protein
MSNQTSSIANDFFLSASKSTEEAFKNANHCIEYTINLAGIFVKLKFAGEELLRFILPAIAHLTCTTDDNTTEYTIEIWDSTSTNTPFPQAPCEKEDFHHRGKIDLLTNERFRAAYLMDARFLSLLDHDEKKAIVCIHELTKIPAYEWAAPLKHIFSWILRKNNIYLVHSAAIGTQDGALLIIGLSGYGKSSTAINGILNGLNYFGDDLCAISTKSNEVLIHSIYSSGKIFNEDFAKLPALFNIRFKQDPQSNYEKEIVFFANNNNFSVKLKDKIVAVAFPHKDPKLNIGFEKTSYAKALSLICPPTKFILSEPDNEIYLTIAPLLKRLPCYRFNLGNNRTKIPEAISELINSVSQE